MDLLTTVRKEGSRGGRAEFQWSDVQNSSHREHYLGHSLMAPVGRWAKGRDLNWYAKADGATSNDEDPVAKAARERKEEIHRVKQAEEDALNRALGLPVAPRSDANAEPISNKREIDKVLQENADDDGPATSGIGFGKGTAQGGVTEEKIEGNAGGQDKELQYALKEYKRRHRDDDREHRSRTHRSRNEHCHKRLRSSERDRRRSRDRKRSRSHEDRHRQPSRSRSPRRRQEISHRRRHRSRSR